tara:strand:+ start:65 stop:484 length:420 start_codon:yes stop_codon:yes gene_type:complete
MVAAVDLSGSVGSRIITQFLCELQAIAESVRPELTHLLGFTHRVTDENYFGEEKALLPGDEFPTELKGYGGTDFRPVFDKVKAMDDPPAFMIMLTDGEAPITPDMQPDGVEVLWLSCYHKPEHYPFGEVIMLPADAARY